MNDDDEKVLPRRGSIAKCGKGTIGMITCDAPQEVTYADGNKGMAWVGVHLTEKIGPIGSPWSSRNPEVIGHIEEFV